MKFNKTKIILLSITLLVFCMSCFFMLYAFYSINKFNDQRLSVIKEEQANLLSITSDSIDNKLGKIANGINIYSKQLSDKLILPNEVGNLLYKDFSINEGNVLGVGVILVDQNQQIKKNRLYWQFQNSQLINMTFNKAVKPEERWMSFYKTNSNHWSRPYYDSILKQYIISYSSVFYYPHSRKIAGVLVLDLDLKSIVNLVAQNIGEKFTSIVTNQGYYIYSIDPDKIVTRTSLTEQNDSMSQAGRQVVTYNNNHVCYKVCHNILSGNSNSYLIYKQMSNLPWLIFANYTNNELRAFNRAKPNFYIMMCIGSIALSIVCVGIFVLIVLVHKHNYIKVLWTGCAFVSLICLFGTVYAWNISRNLSFVDDSDAITSDVKLQNILQPYRDEAKLKNMNKIIEIPTAILVDSVEFLTSYNLALTGTIMQTYPKDYNVTDAIKFNNAFDTKLTKVSDLNSTFYHTVIWTFQTKIRENFDYQHFPFNHGKIWLSISPFNSGSNIIFTPNFSYYNGLSDINANYGVNSNIIIPGWQINGSFFNYVDDKSRMIDEIDSYDTVKLPSLAFNMLINSSISDAIITTIIPPTVIILILFVILLTISKYKNRFIEFKVASIIGSCGGMLFTIVFTHVSLRNKLTSEIMYIEYIYLLMYVVVLLIPVNAFLFATTKFKPVRYGNNLFFKLLFIPLLMGFIFIMTLVSFS